MCLPLSRMVRGSRGPLQPPFAICLGCWDSAQQSREAGGRGGGAGRVSSKAAELSCWLSCLCQLPCPPRLLASPPQGCQGSGHFWTEEFRSQLSVVWCRPPSPREAGCWAQGKDSAPPPSTCRADTVFFESKRTNERALPAGIPFASLCKLCWRKCQGACGQSWKDPRQPPRPGRCRMRLLSPRVRLETGY